MTASEGRGSRVDALLDAFARSCAAVVEQGDSALRTTTRERERLRSQLRQMLGGRAYWLTDRLAAFAAAVAAKVGHRPFPDRDAPAHEIDAWLTELAGRIGKDNAGE